MHDEHVLVLRLVERLDLEELARVADRQASVHSIKEVQGKVEEQIVRVAEEQDLFSPARRQFIAGQILISSTYQSANFRKNTRV